MSAAPKDVDVTKVPPQQLLQLQRAYEAEIDALTSSNNQLTAAVRKFGDSSIVLGYLKEKAADKDIMVPLTSSLYVPGRMEDNQRVLVEVGASYYVEQSTEAAQKYCDRKIKQITESVNKLQEILQLKKLQLNVVQSEYTKRVNALQ